MCYMAILLAIQHNRAYGEATGRHQTHCTHANVVQDMDQDKKPYIQKWERANAGPWDAAVEGNSALRAALISMFGNELASYRKE
eukprot:10800255-Karenia_brevis.AAC.1